MKRTRIVGLNLEKIKKDMTKMVIAEQTKRLVEYAETNIRLIGDMIQMYQSKNHMDRTGNLLDSLCWVVSYDGRLVEGGFYRPQRAVKESHMHELYSDDVKEMFPIYGHGLAEDFIERWGTKSNSGQWVVAFAILAPYWGFWEEGHQNVLTQSFEKFSVMANFYDKASDDLKPAKVRFIHGAPHYTKMKYERMREHMSNSPYHEKRHFSKYPRLRKPKK